MNPTYLDLSTSPGGVGEFTVALASEPLEPVTIFLEVTLLC